MTTQSITQIQCNFLKIGDFLSVGNCMRSACGKYFVVMEANGNLGLYKGSSPQNKGDYLWGSGPVLFPHGGKPPIGDFYAIMQIDGNFVIYKGTGPQAQGQGVWNSGVTAGGNQFYMTIREDGTLGVFKGSDPSSNQGMIWNSGRYFLKPGDYIMSESILVSPSKSFFTILQRDGEIVVSKGSWVNNSQRNIWSSGKKGKIQAYYALLQKDGNWVVYQGDRPDAFMNALQPISSNNPLVPLWSARGIPDKLNYKVVMQENGTVAIVDGLNNFIWVTKNNSLQTHQSIQTGDVLVSNNQKYYAIMQSDGNLAVYRGSGPDHKKYHVWSHQKTAPGGKFFAIMQGDGNFVVYKGTSLSDNQGVVWDIGKSLGQGNYFAIMQDDGSFVVYKGTSLESQREYIWDSGDVVEVPDFDPVKHGFKFPNSFNGKLDIKMFPDYHFENWGFCGGMSAAAINRYNRKIPAENVNSTPKEGDSLYAELYNRQLVSLGVGKGESIIENIAEWVKKPNESDMYNPQHSIGASESTEWNILRKRLDQGKLTILLLIRTREVSNIGENHQVVAFGYRYQTSTKDLTIFIYDPNRPKETHQLLMNLTNSKLNARDTTGNKFRGFFVNPNSDLASR